MPLRYIGKLANFYTKFAENNTF